MLRQIISGTITRSALTRPLGVAALSSRRFILLGTDSSRALNPALSRSVASTVSNRPASQTFDHAALNIREEAGNSAADVAKTIAGGTIPISDKGTTTFSGITSTLASSVPRPVLAFGLLGTIPYVGSGITTVYMASIAGAAAAGSYTSIDPGVAITYLDQALSFQVTYGAIILSFLGALHWGMEFAHPLPTQSQTVARLALGAAPALFAWPTLALAPTTALVLQWVGFTGMWWADAKVTGLGWKGIPPWFAQYRFYLSILVGTCIIGSLAGTSYYGPVAGHGFLSHDLQLTREMRRELEEKKGKGVEKSGGGIDGKVGGIIETRGMDEKGDAYVVIKKRDLTKEYEQKAESEKSK